MEIQKSMSREMMIVIVKGKLDTRSTPEFIRASVEWQGVPLVLDLSGLEYLSSSGLRALLHLKRENTKKGIPVVIAGCNGLVDKVIRVSGFDQIFTLYRTVPEACQAVAPAGA